MSDRSATLRKLYAAYAADDQRTAESLIAPAFTFTSPRDGQLDRNAYFATCWPNGGRIEDISIESLMTEGDAAYVTYKARAPGGRSFRNVEFVTFDGGLIATIDVYFGAAQVGGRFEPRL